MPMGYAALMKTGWVDWGYHTEPQAGMGGRRLYWPRGKVLGGSSSANANDLHSRRSERLRHVGAAWNPWLGLGPCLALFQEGRKLLAGRDNYHGGDGPLKVTRPGVAHSLNAAWIEAGRQAGHPYTPDFNGARQEGFGPVDCTIAYGRRASAAVCYLRPALKRPNLTVEGAGDPESSAAGTRDHPPNGV